MAVERRANAVHAEYQHHARDIDTKFNGTPKGEVGPVQRKLKEYGRVEGLVIGAFSETSKDVSQLIDDMSRVAAKQTWRDMGARDEAEAHGILKGLATRAIGCEAARGNARLKLDRLQYATGWHDPGAAQQRRNSARFGWERLRDERASLSGFARGSMRFAGWRAGR